MFLQQISQCRAEVIASVFDPISARMAKDIGFNYGMIGGSVVSASLIGAPDQGVLTLSELVDSVGRICGATDLPMIVDGDSGYGSHRNTVRLVAELERAGARAVTLEDTDILGSMAAGQPLLIPMCVHVETLKHALVTRQSESFGIIARTKRLTSEPFETFIRRVVGYAEAGVDAICLFDFSEFDWLERIRFAIDTPLMVINYHLTEEQSLNEVNLLLTGHTPYQSAMASAYAALQYLKHGTAEQKPLSPQSELVSRYCY